MVNEDNALLLGYMIRNTLITLALVVLVGVGGYFAYDYIKEKPPSFLIELFTKTAPPPPLPEGPLAPLTAPGGFTATIYSREVPGARVMTRDPQGALLVSQTKEGKVSALVDRDMDGQADAPILVLQGLNQPHGLVVRCEGEECFLYVAETNALKSYRYNPATFEAEHIETLASFPSGAGHYTRTLLEHPDGESLLISIGSSCNVCEEESPLRATMQRLSLVDNTLTEVATGLRNTVFMALHPVTGEVWGTDNGRDIIGDDIPPDEVNIIRVGGDYGWPICYGQNIHDTDFDTKQYIRNPCEDKQPAHIDLPAHSAALGLVFVPEEGWPEGMWHDALIAYHGSWNRSTPTGYKVVRIDLTPEGAVAAGKNDFLTGFLEPGQDENAAIGRPAGLLIEPGGVVFVSDDRAGAIYRVAWNGQE